MRSKISGRSGLGDQRAASLVRKGVLRSQADRVSLGACDVRLAG